MKNRRWSSSSPANFLTPVWWPVVAPPRRNSKLRCFKNKIHFHTFFFVLITDPTLVFPKYTRSSLDLQIYFRNFFIKKNEEQRDRRWQATFGWVGEIERRRRKTSKILSLRFRSGSIRPPWIRFVWFCWCCCWTRNGLWVFVMLWLLLEILWLNIHEVFMIFICVLEIFVYFGVLNRNLIERKMEMC